MTIPVVSAIVVNFNGGAMLQDALASLFAQTWTALEVIVVDNASTDGSLEQAERRFGDKLIVIRNSKNEGFARGNNIGFAAARGDWVFLLNPDAICDPDVIAELMGFVSDKPDVGQLACRVVRADQPHFLIPSGCSCIRTASRGREDGRKGPGQCDRAEEVLAPHGCACALRKSMLEGSADSTRISSATLKTSIWACGGNLRPGNAVRADDARSPREVGVGGNYSVFKAYHVERNRLYASGSGCRGFSSSSRRCSHSTAMPCRAMRPTPIRDCRPSSSRSIPWRGCSSADSGEAGGFVSSAANAGQTQSDPEHAQISVRDWYA